MEDIQVSSHLYFVCGWPQNFYFKKTPLEVRDDMQKPTQRKLFRSSCEKCGKNTAVSELR